MDNKHNLMISRILIGLIFVVSVLQKIFAYGDVKNYMTTVGFFAVDFFLIIAIIIELFGSISLISGYKTKIGSHILIIFMIIVTLVFHLNFSDPNQMQHFLKNVAIIGGLFGLAICSKD